MARLQRIDDRLLLSGGFGLLISVAAAAHALGNRAGLDPGYAWLAPVPFLASAAVLLALFAWRLTARARVNDLRRLAGLSAPDASPRTPFLHSLLALPAVGLLVLYGLTLLYSLRAVYTASRAAGTTYGVIFFLLNAALALAGLAVWRLWREKTPLTSGEVRQVCMPYPAQLLVGMGLFSAGFIIPMLTMGLNAGQLPVLNALFRRNIDFTTSVPLAAEMALGLAYFAVIEFLLFPAIQLWRGMDPSAPAPAQIFTYTHILTRLVLALALAFLLGGPVLLTLAALIVVQQAIEQLTEPITGQPARARLICCGVGCWCRCASTPAHWPGWVPPGPSPCCCCWPAQSLSFPWGCAPRTAPDRRASGWCAGWRRRLTTLTGVQGTIWRTSRAGSVPAFWRQG